MKYDFQKELPCLSDERFGTCLKGRTVNIELIDGNVLKNMKILKGVQGLGMTNTKEKVNYVGMILETGENIGFQQIKTIEILED